MEKKSFLFFFTLFLAIAFVSGDITISPNVQISFGCPSGAFPKNCSGTYYFKETLLNNQSPQYSFHDIKIFTNYTMFDNRKICRTPPFFQYVFNYTDIFNWECCESNWVASNTSCTIGDNQTLIYTDTNNCLFPSSPPPDNGTISYCNYCSESLIPVFGDCMDDSQQSVNYFDTNQATCCDVTNLPTDCNIFTYPFNETTYQACNSTSANIGSPNCRKIPQIGNNVREDCVVEIPVQYKSKPYKCFSIVKDNETGQIVQVNPDVNRSRPVVESREYFTPMYGTLQFYYTGENLNPEKAYIVRAECSSPDSIIYSEYQIERQYQDLSWIGYRIIWLRANANYVVAGSLIVLIIGLILIAILRLIL